MFVVREFDPARGDDAEELAAVVNAAYRGTQGWTNESQLLAGQRINSASLKQELESNSTILVALEEVSNRIVGSIAIHPTKEDDDRFSLGLVSVLPDVQNQGLGRQLLDAAEKWIVHTGRPSDGGGGGVVVVEMSVLTARPELITWYERRGYMARWDLALVDFPLQLDVGVPLLGQDLRLVTMEKPLY